MCPLCSEENDTQEHALACSEVTQRLGNKLEGVEYTDLFGNIESQAKVVKAYKKPTLHPKIPRLFHCKNRFWVITESFFKIESFKRCQNDCTNGAVIWYFHHHCVLFELAEQF